ncbi:MAG: hypothetical protein HN712_25825 [Gemmatimonadetes bacterium]|jgi:hypothetical protein|nr:hypothetical protein [Gemmatimonadota bacterium]MBT6143943.1 hypothetical protein [Gemmatimonadota bacterium]MBT7863762.1 hypothetical protein [Gemmatimonadota bacterium]
MTPTAAAAADAAVLFAAIITLLAIAAKLITANFIQRSKKSSAVLESRRKEISGRLKEVALKRTSARGTLEFWERRRTETQQRVFDVQRDLDAYVESMGPLRGDDDFEEEEDAEGDTENRGFFEAGEESQAGVDEDGILTEPGSAETSDDAAQSQVPAAEGETPSEGAAEGTTESVAEQDTQDTPDETGDTKG